MKSLIAGWLVSRFNRGTLHDFTVQSHISQNIYPAPTIYESSTPLSMSKPPTLLRTSSRLPHISFRGCSSTNLLDTCTTAEMTCIQCFVSVCGDHASQGRGYFIWRRVFLFHLLQRRREIGTQGWREVKRPGRICCFASLDTARTEEKYIEEKLRISGNRAVANASRRVKKTRNTRLGLVGILKL